jgi:type IV pilus assembly protein PilP
MGNVSPLQRYDLGELKFVGMIWGPKGAHALVEDAEGKGYTVTVGTKIGRGGGVVTRISDGVILVKEEFRDFTGTKVVRESSMKLQNPGGR